jgi:2-oxoisovalerate dehydrogenase E2 component (dihydrolipoyl transacylase)
MTPAVRKLAKEMNVNLLAVKGSGPGGRILKEDLYLFADTDSPISGTGAVNSAFREVVSSVAIEPFLPRPSFHQSAEGVMLATLPLQEGGRRVVPLRGVQRLMARSMAESLKVPQLTFSDDIACDKLMRLKEDAKKQKQPSKIQSQPGSESRSNVSPTPSPSIMPFLVKATSLALKKHTIMNCSVLCPDCSEVIYNDDHNIGR